MTAYVFTDATRTYLEANGFDGAAFGAPITVNVNRTDDSCNAYYENRTTNFYAAANDCDNSAADAVIVTSTATSPTRSTAASTTAG